MYRRLRKEYTAKEQRRDSWSPPAECVIMSNNTSNEAKTYSNSYYFSLLTQNEQKHRPPNEDRIRGAA